MADVFVSYKAEDRRRVRLLVNALEADGFTVWWDAQLEGGDEWRDAIARELETAKCVVVVWSKRSVAPEGRFVRDEASRAQARAVYVPVKLDQVIPPLGFGETQAISLVGWKGDRSAAAYRNLVSSVSCVARGMPRPPIQTAAGTYPRRMVLAGGSAAAVTALTAGAGWVWFRTPKLTPEARQLVTEAREGVDDGGVDENGNAIGKLRRASELEPNSAEVWGLLATAYMQQSRVVQGKERQQFVDRGLAAARRARSLEPDQPEALSAEILAMPMFRNWLAVEKASRSALNKHPDNSYLQMRLIEVLFDVGRHDECLSSVEKLLKTISPPRLHVGRIALLWNLGRLDEAENELERTLNRWPRYYAAWFTRFYYLLYNDRAQQALAFAQDTTSRPIGIPSWNFDLVASQAQAIVDGSSDKLHETLVALKDAAHRAAGFAENAAVYASFVGATDAAIEVLTGLYTNRGFDVSEAWFSEEQAIYLGKERNTYFLYQPPMATVRRDQRYANLVREIGLEAYWQDTGALGRVIR